MTTNLSRKAPMSALQISSAARPSSRSRGRFGATSTGVLGLAALALLTACSSGSSATTAAAGSAAPTAAATGAPSGAAGANGRQGGPAASGLIAAADGSTLQVQSQQDGQVAVTWAASTTFTQQVTVAASAIKAGECVTASDPTGSAASTSLTATTIRVTQPVNGSCTGGFGGGTGTRPSGAPSGGTPPSGAPTGGAMPSGAPTRTGAVASGPVVSVSGTTVVVAASQFDPTSGSTPTTVDETVTIAATTKITSQQEATSAAATVGRCASAQGTADSSGTIAATSISVTDAVDGACTGGGAGGFGGGPNGGTANASGTTHG